MTRVAKPLNDNVTARATDVIHLDGEPGSSRAVADDVAPTAAGGHASMPRASTLVIFAPALALSARV
jgi:hypothetical protein